MSPTKTKTKKAGALRAAKPFALEIPCGTITLEIPKKLAVRGPDDQLAGAGAYRNLILGYAQDLAFFRIEPMDLPHADIFSEWQKHASMLPMKIELGQDDFEFVQSLAERWQLTPHRLLFNALYRRLFEKTKAIFPIYHHAGELRAWYLAANEAGMTCDEFARAKLFEAVETGARPKVKDFRDFVWKSSNAHLPLHEIRAIQNAAGETPVHSWVHGVLSAAWNPFA